MGPAEIGHESSLFISDLHLAPDTPAILERFQTFMAGPASRAGRLYILGDLFEAWPGDDELPSPLPAAVSTTLHNQADRGLEIFIMHGNRDFLLGETFARACGAHLLAEPTRINTDGTPTLLLHGDSLCIDDLEYQRFRRQVRDPAWQKAVLSRPLAERRGMAAQMREQSALAKDGKAMMIMDVNADAVAGAFRESGCRRLIHGHTHRPARHIHVIDGRECERWVLPDWHESGGYLLCDGDGCRLLDWAG